MIEKYYSVKEVADMLSVKEQTIRAWIYFRKIKFIKLMDGDNMGTSVRIPASSIEELIKQPKERKSKNE